MALNTWKRKPWLISKSNSKHVCFNVTSQAQFRLMAYSPPVNCRGGPFITSRKESYYFNSFKRLTKTFQISLLSPHMHKVTFPDSISKKTSPLLATSWNIQNPALRKFVPSFSKNNTLHENTKISLLKERLRTWYLVSYWPPN